MAKQILIIGGPKTGKTTYAKKLAQEHGMPLQHFDSHIHRMGWSELSDAIVGWLDEPGPWIKEGVQGVRGLRKWLRENHGKPPFEIHVLSSPKVVHTKGQAQMHKAHGTILRQVLRQLDIRKTQVKHV